MGGIIGGDCLSSTVVEEENGLQASAGICGCHGLIDFLEQCARADRSAGKQSPGLLPALSHSKDGLA
ncbi:MAG: hypothetical protein ACR2RF_01280 [Geminicoccaceae bacterium]